MQWSIFMVFSHDNGFCAFGNIAIVILLQNHEDLWFFQYCRADGL